MKTNKYQESIWISNNPNMEKCVDRFRIMYNGKWSAFGFVFALYGKIGCCDSTSIDGFEMILHCRFWLLIESLGRNIGPLFTTTTLIVVAALALFLPYHSFIDSRLSQSITIFLVNKTNGINENKESNNSYLAINDPSIYECLNDNKWNQ